MQENAEERSHSYIEVFSDLLNLHCMINASTNAEREHCPLEPLSSKVADYPGYEPTGVSVVI